MQPNHRRHTLLKHSHNTAGDIDDAALSSNVALLNRSSQTFTGTNIFSAGTTFTADVSLEKASPLLDVKSTTVTNALLRMWTNSSHKGGIACPSGASAYLTGDAAGDIDIYAVSGNLNFSGNNATRHLIISSTGAATFSGAVQMASNSLVEGAGSHANFALQNNSNASSGLLLQIDSSNNAYLWNYENSPLALATNNAQRVTISAAGGVQFNTFGAGTLVTDASGNISPTSDERLKRDITPFGRGLAEILALNPISYRWAPASGMETRELYTGFSAQNVQRVIPEAVGKMRDDSESLTMSDRPIIAALVNAVKELNARIARPTPPVP